MGAIFNELPNKEELENWIDAYSGRENVTRSSSGASLSYLMRFWESEKGRFLYKMMGNKFIVEMPYEMTRSEDDLKDSVFDSIYQCGKMTQFYNEYRDWVYSNNANCEGIEENHHWLMRLIGGDALAANIYVGCSFKINVNGSTIAVQRGCKPVKTLGKIAHAAGLEGFEDFRLDHSRILNQKKLNGTLCISIHPLDYLTMSDNSYNWDSCMSWRNNGCYRMGTVEMMNSPYVVVAYFKGDKTMRFYHNKWNSKKWRNLFIVTGEYIMGIKGYPYQSSELDEACIKMIKNLAEENLGWNYEDTIYEHTFDSSYDSFDLNDNTYVTFDFYTNFMYNDFGNNNTTHFVLSKDSQITSFCCEYSGPPECMYCGSVVSSDEVRYSGSTAYVDDSDCVLCNDCCHYEVCECCENRIYGNEYYTLDDYILCEECYYEHRVWDPLDEEYHYDGSMNTIYLVPNQEDVPKTISEFYEKNYRYIQTINAESFGLKVRQAIIENVRNDWNGYTWRESVWYVTEEDAVFPGTTYTTEDVVEIFKRDGFRN